MLVSSVSVFSIFDDNQPESLQLCLSLRFWLAWSLMVSRRFGNVGPSQVFSENVPSLGHTRGLLDSQDYVEFFKALIP